MAIDTPEIINELIIVPTKDNVNSLLDTACYRPLNDQELEVVRAYYDPSYLLKVARERPLSGDEIATLMQYYLRK